MDSFFLCYVLVSPAVQVKPHSGYFCLVFAGLHLRTNHWMEAGRIRPFHFRVLLPAWEMLPCLLDVVPSGWRSASDDSLLGGGAEVWESQRHKEAPGHVSWAFLWRKGFSGFDYLNFELWSFIPCMFSPIILSGVCLASFIHGDFLSFLCVVLGANRFTVMMGAGHESFNYEIDLGNTEQKWLLLWKLSQVSSLTWCFIIVTGHMLDEAWCLMFLAVF